MSKEEEEVVIELNELGSESEGIVIDSDEENENVSMNVGYDELNDNSSASVSLHNGEPVYCCDHTSSYVATGGGDDRLSIYHIHENRTVFESQFKDSVHQVRFSKAMSNKKVKSSCDLLAASDMSGLIRVFQLKPCEKKEMMESSDEINHCWVKVWEYEISDITMMCWHPAVGNVLFASTSTSEMWMWLIPSEENNKIFFGSGSPVESFEIISGGREICVAYELGEIKCFDMKYPTSSPPTNSINMLSISNSSSSNPESIVSLTTISDESKKSTLAICGTMLGQVHVADIKSGKLVNVLESFTSDIATIPIQSERDSIMNNGNGKNECSIESLMIWTPPNCKTVSPHLVSASLSGLLIVWDVYKGVRRESYKFPCGINKITPLIPPHSSFESLISTTIEIEGVTLENVEHHICVSTVDGTVYLFDLVSGSSLTECRGHAAPILDISQLYVNDNDKLPCLLTSSDDGYVKLFNIVDLLKSSR